MGLSKLTITDVIYTIEAEQDEIPVRGNCMASGDAAFDKECEDKILRELNSGNIWAWASVKVTARLGTFRGVDYLGACSYKDEEAFKQGGYYDDMKSQALADLKGDIEHQRKQLEEIEL